MRMPSLLVPFPAAVDNHQYYNALAFEKTGAAFLMGQKEARAESVALKIFELMENAATLEKMRTALAQWHIPSAAEQIAANIMEVVTARRRTAGGVALSDSTHLRNQQSAITR